MDKQDIVERGTTRHSHSPNCLCISNCYHQPRHCCPSTRYYQHRCVERKRCILNLGAIVDHGCIIEEGVHICLGAIVKGENRVEKCSKIEAGEVVERGQRPL